MGLGVDLTPLKHLGQLVEDLPKDLEPLKQLPGQMDQMITLLESVESLLFVVAENSAK